MREDSPRQQQSRNPYAPAQGGQMREMREAGGETPKSEGEYRFIEAEDDIGFSKMSRIGFIRKVTTSYLRCTSF